MTLLVMQAMEMQTVSQFCVGLYRHDKQVKKQDKIEKGYREAKMQHNVQNLCCWMKKPIYLNQDIIWI
jgi:hypothetical protein